MVALMPGYYIPSEARIEVNGHVLLFSITMAVLAGIAFGLVPALQTTRPDVAGAMKDERSASVLVRAGAFRSTLIVAEMALSVILLICAGLTIRSFMALQNVDPGFRPENVVTAGVMLPQSRYKTLEERNRFAQELLERVEKIPGVQSANIGNGGMPFGGPNSPYSIDGQPGPDAKPLMINLISPDYFKTMGIAFRRGQMLNADNIRRKDQVAVINETAAKLWPAGEDPVGRAIHLNLLKQQIPNLFIPENATAELTVVGICADTHNDGRTSDTTPAAFIPYTLAAPPNRTLAIRSRENSASIFNSLRDEVKALNPQLPVQNTSTLEMAMAQESAQPRFTMALFSLFAVAGLALATVGLFSVLSYLVTCRTREIGVRMALGAQRGDVLRLVLKDGSALAGLGILVGTIASVGVVRFVGSQMELFKINSLDPVSFAVVISLLSAVALAACWLPARRAARVDPMIALRHE
jgi:putative ABC transport system permease protein